MMKTAFAVIRKMIDLGEAQLNERESWSKLTASIYLRAAGEGLLSIAEVVSKSHDILGRPRP